MSIQYTGSTPVFENAWSQSSGTKAELCSRIYSNFITAGWSSIGTTGSGPSSYTAWTVRSASTPASFQCEVRCDTASTNCVRLYMQGVSGAQAQVGGFFLLPAAAKVWNMIINKYQFFISVQGSNSNRDFACGGVLYIPSFLSSIITNAIWGNSNGRSDTDTTGTNGFRYTLDATHNTQSYQNINGTWWEMNQNDPWNYQAQRLFIPCSAYARWDNDMQCAHWHDYSAVISDPLIAWAINTNAPEALIRGQLWDAFVSSETTIGDSIISFDSHTYFAFTNNNYGSSSSFPPGTLWISTT